jgi:hypothetical protein
LNKDVAFMQDLELHPIEPAKFERRSTTAESYFSVRQNVLYVGKSVKGQKILSTDLMNHEMSHFFLHSTTPYGLFVEAVAFAEQRMFSSLCVQLRRKNLVIPIPLYPFVNSIMSRRKSGQLNQQEERFIDALESTVVPWSLLDHTENIMEGRNVQSVDAEKASTAYNYLVKTENILGEELRDLCDSGTKPVDRSLIPDSIPVELCVLDNESDACPHV